MNERAIIIVGGTSGIGRRMAETYAARGRNVVITGRDLARTREVAESIPGPGKVDALAVDLSIPKDIAEQLAGVGPVEHLALVAIERDENAVADYDIALATRFVTLKLVGYTEVVHTLLPRLDASSSILLFGGQAFKKPYPGSTTVTTVNGGVVGMVHTMAVELAPIRVNGIHPGFVGDGPYWEQKAPEVLEPLVARSPIGRLVTMDEVVGASIFLLENGGVNGVNLDVNGGWLLR